MAPKRVTPELIEQNIGISKEYNNFELIKALAVKDVLKANRIAQYFEKNPKSNLYRWSLPVILNYFSNLLICYYTKAQIGNRIDDSLRVKRNFSGKRLYDRIEKLSGYESF